MPGETSVGLSLMSNWVCTPRAPGKKPGLQVKSGSELVGVH